MNNTSRQRGLTLIETCIALAVVAVSAGIAAPNLTKATERRHVEGTAAQMETDLQFLRSLSVARNQALRISFSSAGYVLHTGSAGDCQIDEQGSVGCRDGAEALRSVSIRSGGPVALRSNVRSMVVDAARGTFTPTATLSLAAPGGAALNVVVNIMGRARACAPAGDMSGYARC